MTTLHFLVSVSQVWRPEVTHIPNVFTSSPRRTTACMVEGRKAGKDEKKKTHVSPGAVAFLSSTNMATKRNVI